MKASNARYAFLAVLLVTILNTACQKAARRPVADKKRDTPGISATEQKIDELIQQGKKAEKCSPAILEKYAAMRAEIKSTNALLEENEVKGEADLSEAISKELIGRSNQLNAIVKALSNEFLQIKVASCGSAENEVSIGKFREESDQIFIAVADRTSSVTSESQAALERLKSKKDKGESPSISQTLVGQKLQVAQALIDLIDPSDDRKLVFISKGAVSADQPDYQKILSEGTQGVCTLEQSPTFALKEDSVLMVLNAKVSTSEELTEVPDKQAVVKTSYQLSVQMGVKNEFLSFDCRLAQDLNKVSSVEQFFKIFGTLLIKLELTN